MPRYSVTVSQTILVEADDVNSAEVLALDEFDFGSSYFETEEVTEDA
jgi:hypothetical protein